MSDVSKIIEIFKELKTEIIKIKDNILYGSNVEANILSYYILNNEETEMLKKYNNMCIRYSEFEKYTKSNKDKVLLSTTDFIYSFIHSPKSYNVYFDSIRIDNLITKIEEYINNSNKVVVDINKINGFNQALEKKSSELSKVVFNEYMFTVYKGIIPKKKSEKLSLHFYDNMCNNIFIAEYIIKRSSLKRDLKVYVPYLKTFK